MDTSSLLHRDLRRENSQRTKSLREIPTCYNYLLVPPKKNLVTIEDCKEVDGFHNFLQNFVDEKIGVTIGEAEKGLTKTELQKRLKTSKTNAAHAFPSQKNAEMHDAQKIPGNHHPTPLKRWVTIIFTYRLLIIQPYLL